MTRTGRIFIVEDDELIGSMLARALKKVGHQVRYESDTTDIVSKIATWTPDITMLDIKLPHMSGLEILQEMMAQGLPSQVIMLTADDSAQTSVKAMKLGASDYLTKPFDIDEVLMVIRNILEREKLRDEVSYFRRHCQPGPQETIIGEAPLTKQLITEIQALATAGVDTIMLTGESGTGKELIANHLHQMLCINSAIPLIKVNCAALPESLLEAELFGHVRGAYTDAKEDKKGLFEVADGGCLLLDEIAEMKVELQSKLLRVLEERTIRRIGGQEEIPIDVTVIASTNKDVAAEVEHGTFRLDLFYRLNTFHLQVAALRDRKEDIIPLAQHFLNHYKQRYKRKNITGFSLASQQCLQEYSWPGNVRELKNIIERLVVLKNPPLIEPHHLPLEIAMADNQPPTADISRLQLRLPPEGIDMENLEKNLLCQAMKQAANNQKQAAKLLHMRYDSFRYKLKKHGLRK